MSDMVPDQPRSGFRVSFTVNTSPEELEAFLGTNKSKMAASVRSIVDAYRRVADAAVRATQARKEEEMIPTQSDLARDLVADLQVCEAATPGTWGCDFPCYAMPWEVGVLSPWSDTPAIEAVASCNLRQGNTENAPFAAQVDERQMYANARMIARSRQGWPVAIRRALAAEAELRKRKRERIIRCAYCDLAWPPGTDSGSDVARQHMLACVLHPMRAVEARVAELEAENVRLNVLLSTCRDDWQGAIEERDEALDELSRWEAEGGAVAREG